MSIELLAGRAWRLKCEEVIDMERESMGGYGPMERDWLLTRPISEWKRRLILGVDKGYVKVRDGVLCPVAIGGAESHFAGPAGLAVAAPTSFTAVASTNAETNLWVPALWSPIPALDMEVGKAYEIKAGGVLGTSSSAPTATWTPRCGQSATPATNITLGATTGSTMIASLAAVPWFWHFNLVIRALGLAASGATGTGNGFIVIGGLTTAVGVVQSMGAAIPTTLDNTAATGLILSLTWGTNHANNTAQAQWVTPVLAWN